MTRKPTVREQVVRFTKLGLEVKAIAAAVGVTTQRVYQIQIEEGYRKPRVQRVSA